MKYFFVALALCFESLAQAAKTPAPVKLFRKILVRECLTADTCLNPVFEQLSSVKTEIPIHTMVKGGIVSLHGGDDLMVEAVGTSFESELFVNLVKGRPRIRATLRSGPGTARPAKTKTFFLGDQSETLLGEVITVKGKRYQAELIVGPVELPSTPNQKTVSLGLRFFQGGKLVCEGRREMKEGEDTFLCAGTSSGRPAKITARVSLHSPTEPEKKMGALLDQIRVSAQETGNLPNGEPMRDSPEIMALDAQDSSIEMSDGSHSPRAMRMEVLPYVLW